jgi:hypothetical protein
MMNMTKTMAILSVICVACLVGAWAYLAHEEVPLDERTAREVIGPATLGWFSPAGEVFRRLGAPEKTELVSSIEKVGPDGPMPEMVSGALESRAPAAVITEHYRTACMRLGLDSPPAPEILETQPELTCHGQYGGQMIGVVVALRCDGERCIISVEVRGQS